MAVEKSIAQLMATPEPAEVEVEAVIDEETPSFASDDTVMLEDGSAIVGYMEEEKDFEGDFYSNLAEEMEEGELDELASELLASYKDDLESRQDWLDQLS